VHCARSRRRRDRRARSKTHQVGSASVVVPRRRRPQAGSCVHCARGHDAAVDAARARRTIRLAAPAWLSSAPSASTAGRACTGARSRRPVNGARARRTMGWQRQRVVRADARGTEVAKKQRLTCRGARGSSLAQSHIENEFLASRRTACQLAFVRGAPTRMARFYAWKRHGAGSARRSGRKRRTGIRAIAESVQGARTRNVGFQGQDTVEPFVAQSLELQAAVEHAPSTRAAAVPHAGRQMLGVAATVISTGARPRGPGRPPVAAHSSANRGSSSS